MRELTPVDPLAAAFADLDAMTLLLNSGETLPITTLLDEDGDECGPEDAAVVVAGSDSRGWWTVPLPIRPDRLN